jgi:hypothetical protein
MWSVVEKTRWRSGVEYRTTPAIGLVKFPVATVIWNHRLTRRQRLWINLNDLGASVVI